MSFLYTWKSELHRILCRDQCFLQFYIIHASLGDIIRKHCIHTHCYVNDTQWYLSMKPVDTNQLLMKTWKSCNFLLLNSDKTEVIISDPKNMTSNQFGITLAYTMRNLICPVLFTLNKLCMGLLSFICKWSLKWETSCLKVILVDSDNERNHIFPT